MPHNVNVNYNGASISVNSIYDQVDLRVQASTADRQGRRREDFSLEIGSSRPGEQAHVSGSRYFQPGENSPSEDEARNGRMRGIQQQPPPLDEYKVCQQYEATSHQYSDQSHPSVRETARAAATARATSSSHRSEVPEDSYYWPESVSTSRSGTGTGYRYAVSARESSHDMRGDRVQYAPGYSPTRGLESGRIQRPGASESFHHQVSQPSHYSPAISTTSSTSRHGGPRNSYHSADSSSYSVSSSDSEETVVAAPAPSSSSSPSAGYHGREVILYGTGRSSPQSSYPERFSHQSADVYEGYQGSLGYSESTCDSYYDDDGGGGAHPQHDGRPWSEASYPYSDSEDNEWPDIRILSVDSRNGRSRQYYR
ncbi:uncharacterized protein LAJ45_08188 [Morchella importuna]|uniref:uncharacterized protein n=1 Tax=Morchella importuna TaxID=1174673 RepID=UPI001E8DD6A6|nr:uncharacterized protein LAJ45_08188 [Morchella importuna]KAH8147723.1 hypothetical protein LAJ45_08188 [Morchella importuna]